MALLSEEELSRFPEDPSLKDIERFAAQVFNYSWSSFGFVRATDHESTIYHEAIGKAVLTLQVKTREDLMDCFKESKDMIFGVTAPWIADQAVRRLIRSTRPFFDADIIRLVFSSLATMAELVLFLDNMGYEVPLSWLPIKWTYVYKMDIQQKLQRHGGWRALIQAAHQSFIQSNVFNEYGYETQFLEYPYQSFQFPILQDTDEEGFPVRRRGAWMMDAPDLFMDILNHIYSEDIILDDDEDDDGWI